MKTEEAQKITERAKEKIGNLRTWLARDLERNPIPSFKTLKSPTGFVARGFTIPRPLPRQRPKTPRLFKLPAAPVMPSEPHCPSRSDLTYQIKPTLIDRILPYGRSKLHREAELRFLADYAVWIKKVEELRNSYRRKLRLWEENTKRVQLKNDTLQRKFDEKAHKQQLADEDRLAKWESEKKAFELDQINKQAAFEERQNHLKEEIAKAKQGYARGTPTWILKYFDFVLSKQEQPRGFPRSNKVYYDDESKLLLVDRLLPAVVDLPSLSEARYNRATDQIQEKHLPIKALNQIYDDLVCQISLATLSSLFRADQRGMIAAIVFNGSIRSIDKGTGKSRVDCVLSMHVTADSFRALDLQKVDPKECVKKLRGVCSGHLHEMIPVAPIVQINMNDCRFVGGHRAVTDKPSMANLASMDWEDFEHLVREVFEKEFASNGGEVKITQASRDGGVDAVAFDPDPIRGGKIVIQAKRYTNVVELSAVRDLYGTLMNEGANKGILVTTSGYGPDSYEFAKDKPLTLLNGSNLLHLLEKHGHKAEIDLARAKRELANKKQK